MTEHTYELLNQNHTREEWLEDGQPRRRVYDFKNHIVYRDEIETAKDPHSQDPRKRFENYVAPDRIKNAHQKHLEMGGDHMPATVTRRRAWKPPSR
mgnify:CR=1 FL=1